MAHREGSQYIMLDELSPNVEVAGCWNLQEHSSNIRMPGHQLFLIETGQVNIQTADLEIQGKRQDLICLRPADRVQIDTAPSTLIYTIHVTFAQPPREKLTPWLEEKGALPQHIPMHDAFDEMRNVFEKICIEMSQCGAEHRLRVRACVLEILAVAAGKSVAQTGHAAALDAWERTRLRLGCDLQADIKIEGLARQMGLSTDHFIRRFKQRFGVSPKLFRTRAKVREAARLLHGTDQPVKWVAHTLGFADTKSFVSTFKRHLGVTPSDLRTDVTERALVSPVKSASLFTMNKPIVPPNAAPDWLEKFLHPLVRH